MEKKSYSPYSKFADLRKLMNELGVTQLDLVDWWNAEHTDTYKYPQWMSAYFTGRKSFPLDLCYWIMDRLGVPHAEIYKYFPARGIK